MNYMPTTETVRAKMERKGAMFAADEVRAVLEDLDASKATLRAIAAIKPDVRPTNEADNYYRAMKAVSLAAEALRAGDGRSAPVEAEDDDPPRLAPYSLDPEAVCADRPDVRVADAEALEVALRRVLDEDEACDAALVVLAEGWSPTSASTPSASPDLASLVASLTRERDNWHASNFAERQRANRAEAQVAVLTRERDEARANGETWRQSMYALESRVAVYRQALEHIASLPDLSGSARRRADALAREALAAAVVVGQPGESPAGTGGDRG